MDGLYELLRACQVVVHGTLGVVAVLQWRRRRTPTTAWLAATFGTLGTVIIAARIIPTEPPTSVLRKLLVVGVILFPYLLYRFTRTFVARSRPLFWLATTVTGALIAATFLVQCRRHRRTAPLIVERATVPCRLLASLHRARWWRQRMSREILPVELALMEATTPGEVGTILLPQASELMGGCGTVLAIPTPAVLASPSRSRRRGESRASH